MDPKEGRGFLWPTTAKAAVGVMLSAAAAEKGIVTHPTI